MDSRNDWVDYAKAIGISLVVYGHVARGLYNAGIFRSADLYELIDSIVYSFHMPLFFFLSGLFFISSFSKKGAGDLIFSKVDTIIYPYVIWSLLQGSVEVMLANFANGDASFRDVFSLLWAPRAQFWFLYALFLIFVVTCAFYSLVSARLTLVLFSISILLYLLSPYYSDVLLLKYISQNLVFFVLGIVFSAHLKLSFFSSVWSCAGLAISFVLAQWVFHGYFSLRYTDLGIRSLLLACISIAFIVSMSASLARRHFRFLAYIGASSLVIYLLHILASAGSRVILSKLFGTDSLAIHLLVGCSVGLLAPLAALAVINKAKIPYVFSAPISSWVKGRQATLQRAGR